MFVVRCQINGTRHARLLSSVEDPNTCTLLYREGWKCCCNNLQITDRTAVQTTADMRTAHSNRSQPDTGFPWYNVEPFLFATTPTSKITNVTDLTDYLRTVWIINLTKKRVVGAVTRLRAWSPRIVLRFPVWAINSSLSWSVQNVSGAHTEGCYYYYYYYYYLL
jgi:hypothetical protein